MVVKVEIKEETIPFRSRTLYLPGSFCFFGQYFLSSFLGCKCGSGGVRSCASFPDSRVFSITLSLLTIIAFCPSLALLLFCSSYPCIYPCTTTNTPHASPSPGLQLPEQTQQSTHFRLNTCSSVLPNFLEPSPRLHHVLARQQGLLAQDHLHHWRYS
jgi:hypothetical protein